MGAGAALLGAIEGTGTGAARPAVQTQTGPRIVVLNDIVRMLAVANADGGTLDRKEIDRTEGPAQGTPIQPAFSQTFTAASGGGANAGDSEATLRWTITRPDDVQTITIAGAARSQQAGLAAADARVQAILQLRNDSGVARRVTVSGTAEATGPIADAQICRVTIEAGGASAAVPCGQSQSVEFTGTIPAGAGLSNVQIEAQANGTTGQTNVAFDITVAIDDCTIRGTDAGETLQGTAGNDVICGLGGDDVIHGNGGQDTLRGGPGRDLLVGDTGLDTIDGDDGDDVLVGGDTGDRLTGGPGNDSIIGGDGSDVIDGGEDDDLALWGCAGNDRITGGTGADNLEGGRRVSLTPVELVLALTGEQVDPAIAQCRGSDPDSPDRMTGGDGADTLSGGDRDDLVMEGGKGNDVIRGGDGDDTIKGGPGSDTLRGGIGFDRLFGGDGPDDLFGDEDDDRLDGGAGHDRQLRGGPGSDRIEGGSGDDLLIGGTRKDVMLGQAGRDRFKAIDGVRDTVNGGPGQDVAAVDQGIDRVLRVETAGGAAVVP